MRRHQDQVGGSAPDDAGNNTVVPSTCVQMSLRHLWMAAASRGLLISERPPVPPVPLPLLMARFLTDEVPETGPATVAVNDMNQDAVGHSGPSAHVIAAVTQALAVLEGVDNGGDDAVDGDDDENDEETTMFDDIQDTDDAIDDKENDEDGENPQG